MPATLSSATIGVMCDMKNTVRELKKEKMICAKSELSALRLLRGLGWLCG